MSENEIERRFIVTLIDPDIQREKGTVIEQGYFDAGTMVSIRVRIMNNERAELTRKSGIGLVRKEEERQIDLETARFLMDTCPYAVFKTRYVRDGWEVDFFSGPLAGLVLAEFEMENETDVVTLPDWIHKAKEVTHSVTNLHLARMSMEMITSDKPVRDYLAPRLPRIVLTGGPCSGKSTLIEMLRNEFGDDLHCVPEVATILISQVGLKPSGDKVHGNKFQRTLMHTQKSLEEASDMQARLDGRRSLLLDRGIMDNAAYIGGCHVVESMLNTSVRVEYSNYDLIIHLGLPSKEDYEKNRLNNPARSEDFIEADMLSKLIEEAWRDHPNLQRVTSHDWNEKVARVRSLVSDFLGNL